MANICSVTMCFYGEKSAVEDLHAKCQRWMDTGGKATKLLSALNINKEGLNLRCEACYVGELFIGPTGDQTFVLDADCAWDATLAFDIFDRIILRDYVDQNGESKIKYDWIAEEPECQIFEKHNEGGNCSEKYHLVISDDNYFPVSDEELLDVMEKLFKRQFTGTEEIRQFIAVYADEHPYEYISLNEFVEC